MDASASANRGARARLMRQIHLYLGMFFAPTILFFAVTGSLQLYGLHEASRDGSYSPAPVIEKLSEVHIHQRFALAPKPQKLPGAQKRAEASPQVAPAPKALPPKPPVWRAVVRAFFLAAALGLIASALLGLWIGVVQARRRGPALLALAAGMLVPIILVAL